MDIRLIKAPSDSVLEMIKRRSTLNFTERPGAIGLVQGKFIEMVVAADISEKCVNVEIADVRGSCPQNFVLLCIAGDVASVKEALTIIQENNGESKKW